jgi:hypothetical protein
MAVPENVQAEQPQLVNKELVHFVITRPKIHPILIWFFSALLTSLFFAFLALITGELAPQDKIGFINDYGLFHIMLLGIPAIVTFHYLWPSYFDECLRQLHKSGVIGISPENESKQHRYDFDIFINNASKSLHSKWWWIFSLILSAGFMMVAVPEHLRAQHWDSIHIISLIPKEIFWFIIFSILALLALRIIIGIWWINKAFKQFQIVIKPLHPDRVGGLRPLNQLSMQLGLMIFVLGIELAANQFTTMYFFLNKNPIMIASTPPDLIAAWIIYLLLAPVLFFAPLAAAHKSMQNAKDIELMILCEHFERRYKSLRKLVKEDLDTEQKTNAIRDIWRLYEKIETFPVWPFQMQKLVQFSITVLLPLLLAILAGYIVEIAKKWMGY